MTTSAGTEQQVTIFKKGRKKSDEQWYVQMTSNFLEPRIYGPFTTKADARHFQEGAEFELRKLLDFELRIRSGGYGPGATPLG